MVGLDAAEPAVVERLMDAGRMPNLAALRARGWLCPLEARPPAFLSMVWPNLVNGAPVTEHGWYFGKVWDPDRMRLEHVGLGWLPQRPFWEACAGRGMRVGIVDVPFAPAPGPGFEGVFLNGWQCHDDAGRGELPEGLTRELHRRFGAPRLKAEQFGPQTPAMLLALRDELLGATRQAGEVAAWLLGRERFDLFCAVIGGTHRGGHYLWDLSQVDAGASPPADRARLEGAVEEIYAEADAALGRIAAAAPADARIVAFALHGMGPNGGWADLFPELVELVRGGGGGGEAPRPKAGLAYRLKKALPLSAARALTSRLPPAVNHRLVKLWSARMHDWSTTRWFALPVDVNGYLRINLRGREAQGIVEPGPEYEALCAELAQAFGSLVEVESGAPIVAGVDRVDELAEAGSDVRRYLPDLVVRWADVPATATAGVRLPGRGEVRWPRGARLRSGRSANHLGRGWLLAAGPGIPVGRDAAPRDATDLPPTVLSWLGVPVPAHVRGRAVEELVRG
jgi:predicted AlkP superfamily phosphohydrolase/phosphomutase